MTIDGAIQELTNLQNGETTLSVDTTFRALKLGIEALKSIKAQYDPDHKMMRKPLPGETID